MRGGNAEEFWSKLRAQDEAASAAGKKAAAKKT
jgi:hypothetical protein